VRGLEVAAGGRLQILSEAARLCKKRWAALDRAPLFVGLFALLDADSACVTEGEELPSNVVTNISKAVPTRWLVLSLINNDSD
jgi:hypothetical protein